MTRPRRSQQARSLRSLLRWSARSNEIPTAYRAEGHTLTTVYVSDSHGAARARRLDRAEAARAQANDDLDASVCAWSRPTPAHDACVARYEAAEAELKAAQRSASRPVGELVTPRHAEVYRPIRTWPNALPGGTSLRRRTIMKGRVALADHGYYDYPGGYAYGARLWGTFTAAAGRQPWVPVHVGPRVI